jgi:hypothetical protein
LNPSEANASSYRRNSKRDFQFHSRPPSHKKWDGIIERLKYGEEHTVLVTEIRSNSAAAADVKQICCNANVRFGKKP